MTTPLLIEGGVYQGDGAAIARVGQTAVLDLQLAAPDAEAGPFEAVDLDGRFFVQRLIARDGSVLAEIEPTRPDEQTVRFTLLVTPEMVAPAKAADLTHKIVELLADDEEDEVLARRFSIRALPAGAPSALMAVGAAERMVVRYVGDRGLSAAQQAKDAGLISEATGSALADYLRAPSDQAGAAAAAIVQEWSGLLPSAAAIHEDAVSAGLDRVATAADRLVTAADRVVTTADRGVTTADRVVTTADRTVTTADRVQTGLDRVQTGADRALAQGYASDAAVVSGVNVPSYASRASLGGATVAAAIKAVATRGFATEGDGVQCEMVRVSFASLGAYPAAAYTRSADRFMPDGSTHATNGGYWLLQPGPNGYDVRAFGALLNNAANDAPAAIACAQTVRAYGTARAAFYVPPSSGMYFNTAVDLELLRFINVLSDIRTNPAIGGIAVPCGGFSNGLLCSWNFQAVTDGTSPLTAPAPARPIMQWCGVKAGPLKAGACNFLQVYADNSRAGFDSTAWNNITLFGVQTLVRLTDAGGFSWLTENIITAERIIGFEIIPVGYIHNRNGVINGTFEGPAVSIKIGGTDNFIEGARFEDTASAPGIEWLPGAKNNRITYTYDGTLTGRVLFDVPIPVTDNGAGGNTVDSPQSATWARTELFSISQESTIVGSETESNGFNPNIAPAGYGLFAGTKQILTPGRGGVSYLANRIIGGSSSFVAEPGDVITYRGGYTGSRLRPLVNVFDPTTGLPILSEAFATTTTAAAVAGATTITVASRGAIFNGQAISVVLDDASVHTTTVVKAIRQVVTLTAAIPAGRSVLNGAVVTATVPWVSMLSGTFNAAHGHYATGADLLASALLSVTVQRRCIIRAAVFGGAAGFITSVSATLRTPTQGRARAANAAALPPRQITLDGAPFMGIVPVNTLVFNRLAKTWHWPTFHFSATVNGALAAGNASVTFTAIGAMGNGDIIDFVLDDGTPFWAKLAGVSGNTANLMAADGTTPKPIPAGRSVADLSAVRGIRWVTSALLASATFDPPSLLPGQVSPTQTISVTNAGAIGALAGDFVVASFSNPLQGAEIVAWVSATNVVSYYFRRSIALLSGSAVYDPPSLLPGQVSPTQTVAVSGALVGDLVDTSFSNPLQGAEIVAWVSATNVVSYYFRRPDALLSGSATYDPPSLAAVGVAGASVTTTVTVTGAALGDVVTASFSQASVGVAISASVSAPDTVSVVFSNTTGAPIDLASGTLRTMVRSAAPLDLASGTVNAIVRSTTALDLASGTVRVRVIKQ